MTDRKESAGLPTRRNVLSGAAAGALSAVMLPGAAYADPETLQREIWRLMGPKKAVDDRIRLDIPELAENGAVVPVRVTVESPMTPQDHVQAIHILADENPWPTILSLSLSPRAGKADVRTRIRLARTQRVFAFAEMSDGSLYRTVEKVAVTIGGCG